MVAILEKTEHNTDFHQIVDFLEASHIRIETMNQETKILATVDGKPHTIFESSLRRHLKVNDEEEISSLPDTKLFENLSLMGYNILPNQSNIATTVVCLATNRVYNFSKMFFDGMVRNISNEPASLLRDDRQRGAFPTVSSLDAGQDRENNAKTSAMPHESSSRVLSLGADEGSMQQRIHELMELCTSLQRQQSQMAAKIKDQDLEIFGFKARVKSLEDKERRHVEPTQEDAPITGGIIDIGEELGVEKSTELGSNDTEEMVNVLSSVEAANILSCGGAAASVSPADVLLAAGVPTVSGSFPTVSVIFTTASVEQTDAQVAKEMEEEFARENQRMKISEGASEEELKGMMQLVPLEEVYIEALQQFDREDLHQLWTLVKETFSTKQATRDKEKELWVELKRLFEPDFKNKLWTHHQAFMHDLLDWKLYDTCGVHHVSTKDQEIFMLVEKDYPLRKGLATVMIIQDEELIEASSLQAFPLLVMMILLLVHFATVSAKEFHCWVATAKDFALMDEDKIFSQSKTRVVIFKMYHVITPLI
nr:hypothetical protein [Tanacetum cinerariifolium]